MTEPGPGSERAASLLGDIAIERQGIIKRLLDIGPDSDFVAEILKSDSLPIPRWKLTRPGLIRNRLGRLLPAEFAKRPEVWSEMPPFHPYVYGEVDVMDDSDTEDAQRLLDGFFRAHPSVEWEESGVPPGWEDLIGQRRDLRMYKHSLQWAVPLIKLGFGHGRDDAADLFRRVLSSWMTNNSTPPGLSTHAWYDHAVAIRTRVMLLYWEQVIRSPGLSVEWMRLLLASLYQHLEYLTDDANFKVKSNHGLEMAGSLLAGSYQLAPFDRSKEWRRRASEMLDGYLALAFSEEGFNREQSPTYQEFIMRRLAEIDGYLTRNGLDPHEKLRTVVDNALSGFPYLIRHNETVPTIGDSSRNLEPGWRDRIEAQLGRDLPAPRAEPVANPRGDGSTLIVSPGAGYAIFSTAPPGGQTKRDLHLTFKYNYFEYPHFHNDGLSFVMYWRGVEWLIDPGRFGYDWDRPERKYVRSSRAHNVVMVDDQLFDHWPVSPMDPVRSSLGDAVASTHHTPGADHTRAVAHLSDGRVEVLDHLIAADDDNHAVTVLWHFNERAELSVNDNQIQATVGKSRLTAEIEASRDISIAIIEGQTEPRLHGWWSPANNVFRPAPVAEVTFDFCSVASIRTAFTVSRLDR